MAFSAVSPTPSDLYLLCFPTWLVAYSIDRGELVPHAAASVCCCWAQQTSPFIYSNKRQKEKEKET